MIENRQGVIFSALLPEEIASFIPAQPAFRSKQICKWIADGAHSFEHMHNIPAALRASLAQQGAVFSSKVHTVLKGSDGSIKLQIELVDGCMVETVLLVDREGRKTACVSSQAGCAMGCRFCKTGSLGFARNLTAAEIVEQFFALEKQAGTLQNIVFMGMGEPLLNLEAVRKALGVLSFPQGRALSLKRVTVSTCGIINGIYDLADNGPAVRLAVSLTCADEKLRNELMPFSASYPLDKLAQAVKYYTSKTSRRCTLEAALLSGINTDSKSADKLIAFAHDLGVHINLIPWNPVETLPYMAPTKTETYSFYNKLKAAGLNVTVRTKRGASVSGACGQLGKTQIEHISVGS